jgi:uncharacterized protein (DUF1778 family)
MFPFFGSVASPYEHRRHRLCFVGMRIVNLLTRPSDLSYVRFTAVQRYNIFIDRLKMMEIDTDSSTQTNKVAKNARLEARVTLEQKQLMERAAGLRGQNLTEFMISVLADAAVQTIKDRESIELSERDRLVFAEALLNPAPASERAIADARWYAQMMSKRESD